MSEENSTFVRTEVQSGIAWLILDRPPVNVLNIEMIRQLQTSLGRLAGDGEVQTLVLRATGKLFSAGVDVADHTADKVDEMIPLFNGVCRALADFPVPTIAAVHGHALGGACELVLCCDLAVMADGAKIGQPEIKLASMAPVAALRLPYLVGYRAAADLMFTGRNLSAQEAQQSGLVNDVVPLEEIGRWVEAKAAELTGLSRAALVILKRALHLGFGAWAEALPQVERLYLEELMSTADAHEGVAAFMEKRTPVWQHQ